VLRGSLLIAVITAAAYRIHLNSAATGFLYLIAIVLNCLDGGMLPAAVVSVVAVGCLDFFFVQPVLTFTVADPIDAAALAAFLTTSLVVTRLASQAREQAKSAERERANLARLYELAQRLLAVDPLRAGPARLLEPLCTVFQLRAACLFDGSSAEIHTCGESASDLAVRTRDAFIMGRDRDDIRLIRAAGKPIGALGFETLPDQALTAGPVPALVAAALERMRATRAASEAAAETRTETLRAAILDALAHEFKTPMATILTAAGGLHATGPLTPEQQELADLLETEATRLNNLTASAGATGQPGGHAATAVFDLQSSVASLVDRYRNQFPDRELSLTSGAISCQAAADQELFELAVGQLLDNACRYAPARSEIRVSLEFSAGCGAIVVWNGGPGIAATERRRIFERFYRGVDGRRLSSGTGLGLYVARKIALAHGGNLDIDRVPEGVAFRLTIPMTGEEFDLDESAAARADCG
jgi:two-component system, OmpR family, sensor histidine kinase KdpD